MPELAAVIGREIELISRFLQLLRDEQAALQRIDPGPLPEIASAKSALVDQLNNLEEERRRMIGLAVGENARQAMEAWLTAHPGEKAIIRDWQTLLSLSAEAREQHQLNAGLVAMHLQQTNEALAILTRQPPQAELYGSDGQTSLRGSGRIVDSA